MNLLSCCLLRTRSRLVLLVLAFFGALLPFRAWADGAEGGAEAPDPSAHATPGPHRLQLTAGTHWMLEARDDYGSPPKFTPSLQAGYLYRAFRYLELGAGLSGYLWTESDGGPIVLPYAAVRAFAPFTSDAEAVELGFSLRMGVAIGYYHADIRNDPDHDHDPIHTGFGFTFGPDVRIPLDRGTSLHFALELSGFGEEQLSINYYKPLGTLGAALGIVTAL
jgi:hypothetical protein